MSSLRRDDGDRLVAGDPIVVSCISAVRVTQSESESKETKEDKRKSRYITTTKHKEIRNKAMAVRRGRLLCTIILRKGPRSCLLNASAYDDGYDDGRGLLRLVVYDSITSSGASVELNRYECELIVGLRTELLCEDRRKEMARYILEHRLEIEDVDESHTYVVHIYIYIFLSHIPQHISQQQ